MRQKSRLDPDSRKKAIWRLAVDLGTINAAYLAREFKARNPGLTVKETTIIKDLQEMRQGNDQWLDTEFNDTWMGWIRERWPMAVERIRDLDAIRKKIVETAGAAAPPGVDKEVAAAFEALEHIRIAVPLARVTEAITKEEQALAQMMEDHPLYHQTKKFAQWYSAKTQQAGV